MFEHDEISSMCATRSSEIIQDVGCSCWWNAFDIDARFSYRKFANSILSV